MAGIAQVSQMVLFARVVDAGNFSNAARTLGLTRAAVSKRIAGLEAEIGAQLLHRTTRQMSLTEIGRAFYERCARIAAEVEAAERAVAALQGAPRGRLRVSAPVTFGRRYLSPLVSDFLERQPEVQVDLALSDSATAIPEGFDLAIRIARRPEAGCVVHRLAPSRHVVCASPEYARERSLPSDPDELRRHNCLLYSSLETPGLWRFRERKTVRVSGNFAVDHGESLRQAVLDGLGVAYMPTFLVGPDVAAGRLLTALDEWALSTNQIFALYPRGPTLTPKLRAFLEHLLERFRDGPPWEHA
jgi:DNA-binding transcriptional LysR family regulator